MTVSLEEMLDELPENRRYRIMQRAQREIWEETYLQRRLLVKALLSHRCARRPRQFTMKEPK